MRQEQYRIGFDELQLHPQRFFHDGAGLGALVLLHQHHAFDVEQSGTLAVGAGFGQGRLAELQGFGKAVQMGLKLGQFPEDVHVFGVVFQGQGVLFFRFGESAFEAEQPGFEQHLLQQLLFLFFLLGNAV